MARAGGPEGTARAERLIQALEGVGRSQSLSVQREYPVRGGRIDLVWSWATAPSELGLGSPGLPVVGFEIESSWRTRKHIKGDYLNLYDLGASLGVIVLLGSGAEVESTARFASVLVDRPGPRIVVWTEADAQRIFGEDGNPARIEGRTAQSAGSAIATLSEARDEHAGKYRGLWEWLRSQPGDEVEATFHEIEEILGQPLPPSSYRHAAHWSGYEGSAVARAIRDAGWRASHVDLARRRVTFLRR